MAEPCRNLGPGLLHGSCSGRGGRIRVNLLEIRPLLPRRPGREMVVETGSDMRLAVAILALLLVLASGASAYLVLQACGVLLPLTGTRISVCEDPGRAAVRAELAGALQDRDDLSAQVAGLEREIALLQCKAEPPPPPPPPPPETPSGLAPDAFDENDISVMEGCWELSSNYDVRDIRTNRITRFRYWQICFDENGNGREVMRATNGTRCEGRLSGTLNNGQLSMREPGNLQCDNGSEIFRRDVFCTLDAQGVANCDSLQPEINGRGSATLRRAGR